MFYTNKHLQNARQQSNRDAHKALNDELAAQRNGSVSFASAVAVEVMLSGKGDEKNIQRAVDAIYKSRREDNGPYRRALAINDAVRGCDSSLKALVDFVVPRWKDGLDVRATDTRNQVYDSEIRQALVREGIVLSYILPRDLRPHLRIIAHQAARIVKASPKFQEGLQALTNGKPASIVEQIRRDELLKNFDREVLLGMDALRRAIMELGVGAKGDGAQGYDFVGPTGWSLTSAERLVMCDFVVALTGGGAHLVTRTLYLIRKKL